MSLGLSRFRAFFLLLVFGMSLAGRIVVDVAMAAPMNLRAGTQISAAGGCPACSGATTDAMPLHCVVVCWNLIAIPATGPVIPLVGPTAFVAAIDANVPGLSPGPDPHPPRVLFSV